jgi:hypothetical protein
MTTKPKAVIPNTGSNGIETDDDPSTFWITNPQNSFVRSVAAGSESTGFWFELLVRGSRAEEFNTRASLTLFQSNVAHSNVGRGFKTYPSGYVPDEEATFFGLKSYMNGVGMFLHRSNNIKVVSCLFAEAATDA